MTIDEKHENFNHSQHIKCVVWDLDNTIWKGVLIEDGSVFLQNGILDIIRKLDERGILQSIASKNEYSDAMAKLKEFGIGQYLLYPQISWNHKSESIRVIAGLLNINTDAIALIDDEPFERDEVKASIPNVLCIDSANVNSILSWPEFTPRFINEDSMNRRKMYLCDMERNINEQSFTGTHEEFLASLDMVFTISPVSENDLRRVEELTARTHQFNTTGYTYSYEELDGLRKSETHKLFIANLVDKFGNYGNIGIALLECFHAVWTIKLLLMSCRVISRGVGTVMISYLMNFAKKNNVFLRAEFIPNARNRAMYITYKLSNFKEIGDMDGKIILENDLSVIKQFPPYVRVYITDE